MVHLSKEDNRTRPQTICRITSAGRNRYLEYLTTLEQVVRDAARSAKSDAASSQTLRALNPSRA